MRSTHRLRLLLSAGAAGLLLAALPVGLASVPTTALAGSGNGKGNGNAGVHGSANANGQGATSSSLGALNAAHASPNALANANPNSRVGRIAAYKEAALAAQSVDQPVADAQATVDADQATVDADKKNLDSITEAANADGTVTPQEQAQIDAAQAQLDTDTGTLTADQGILANAQATAAPLDAARDQALEAAANKPISDEVVDAVNHLLGIE